MNAVLISDNSGTHWRLGGAIPLGVPGCRVGNLTTRECGDEIQVAEVMWPANGLLAAVIRNPGHPAMSFSSDAGTPIDEMSACLPACLPPLHTNTIVAELLMCHGQVPRGRHQRWRVVWMCLVHRSR